jgi:hypothetical protein
MESQIREAAAALRGAADEQQKADATKRLGELLNAYFEEDVRRRETELAQIEERVKKLREQLNRRREKKQEIIDLQMKVALNEADGLGFFSRPAGREYGSLLDMEPPARRYPEPAMDATPRVQRERPMEGEPPRSGGSVTPPPGRRGNQPRPRPAPGGTPTSDDFSAPTPAIR